MEKEDYQTAVGRFIDTYGEGPFLYAIGKTKAVNGGLSPSKAFGDWEQSHGGFLGSYSKVGGFFGPVGDDFSMEVYQRQLDQGERKRLTDQQMLDASQSTTLAGKNNADLRQWLDGGALEIARQHPEFQRVWDFLLSREVDDAGSG